MKNHWLIIARAGTMINFLLKISNEDRHLRIMSILQR